MGINISSYLENTTGSANWQCLTPEIATDWCISQLNAIDNTGIVLIALATVFIIFAILPDDVVDQKYIFDMRLYKQLALLAAVLLLLGFLIVRVFVLD